MHNLSPDGFSETINLIVATVYNISLCPRTKTDNVLDAQDENDLNWDLFCNRTQFTTTGIESHQGVRHRPYIENAEPVAGTIRTKNRLRITFHSDTPYDKYIVRFGLSSFPANYDQQFDENFKENKAIRQYGTEPNREYRIYIQGGIADFFVGYKYTDWSSQYKAMSPPKSHSLRYFFEVPNTKNTIYRIKKLMEGNISIRSVMGV